LTSHLLFPKKYGLLALSYRSCKSDIEIYQRVGRPNKKGHSTRATRRSVFRVVRRFFSAEEQRRGDRCRFPRRQRHHLDQ